MRFQALTMMRNLAFMLAVLLVASQASAINRYVDTGGSDLLNTCALFITPCATVQHAIQQSINGDVINIASGTYSVSGLISVNKSVTLLGAQAGVDARTRAGSESVLSNSQGISVSASNVVFDGLTIQDSSVGAYTGYGVWINPGVDGTIIVNTIIRNNIIGLGISNTGASQALIQHNLFRDNNLPGSASGTAIYTDQYVSGAVSNVLISENSFINNNNAGIGFSSTDTLLPDTDITVTGNEFDGNGRGMYFFNAQLVTIANNTITNLPAPTDGGSSVGIAFYGAVSDALVEVNHLENGARYGIRLGAFIDGTPPPANANISIHNNNIISFAVAGLHVDDAPVGPQDYATCNWWGSATGPSNATLNPGGSGDVVEGDITNDTFDPWLLGLAPDSPCGGTPSVAKSFSPDAVCRNNKSTLTITLNNPTNTAANLTAPLIDGLPSGLKVRGNSASTDCGGVLTAPNNSTTITLINGVIPANGSCTITVRVAASQTGAYINTIPAGSLETDVGSNATDATATLNVFACGHSSEQDQVPLPISSQR